VAALSGGTVNCPACSEPFPVKLKSESTSDLAPAGKTAVVFIQPDLEDFRRHLAVHVADAEEAAA
jgi:hypothetical protein